jgi:glycosyltransferase involved in cell wall biosynthesis
MNHLAIDSLARAGTRAGPAYIADFSLALINRTGAYYICRDIVEGASDAFAEVRYWRCRGENEPSGLRRRLLGRAMLLELRALGRWNMLARPRGGGGAFPTLFLDPLYALRSRLQKRDIVLCHDVGPISHPELFDDVTSRLYQEAYDTIKSEKPGIVFVSQASRNEFVARFGSDYRFLEVIPLYVRQELGSLDERAPDGIGTPFLLTVGALETRKNYRRIIEAFRASGLHRRGYTYIFCGPRGNSASEVETLVTQTEGVRYLGYRSDAEVRWLYRHATGFVLPSLLEGFGLPALEAAQQGLVSVIGSGEAQREAVGEGAILVDPHSVESIRDGILELVDMGSAERRRRLDLAQRYAADLSKERFVRSWSQLLGSPFEARETELKGPIFGFGALAVVPKA